MACTGIPFSQLFAREKFQFYLYQWWIYATNAAQKLLSIIPPTRKTVVTDNQCSQLCIQGFSKLRVPYCQITKAKWFCVCIYLGFVHKIFHLLMCRCTYTPLHHKQIPKIPKTITYKTVWQSFDHHIKKCATLANHFKKTSIVRQTVGQNFLEDGDFHQRTYKKIKVRHLDLCRHVHSTL